MAQLSSSGIAGIRQKKYGINLNVRRRLTNVVSWIDSIRIRDKNFVLVSNNCWGSDIYQALGREYNTPFVGLFLFPDCYIKLLENFENVLSKEIRLDNESKYFSNSLPYPVGHTANQIEIHFLHYNSFEEAQQKWTRRADRLHSAVAAGVPVFVKFCDREDATTEHFRKYHELAFQRKISMSVAAFSSNNHLCIPKLKSDSDSFVIDGKSLFGRRYQYFDFAHWIREGECKQTMMSRLLSLIS